MYFLDKKSRDNTKKAKCHFRLQAVKKQGALIIITKGQRQWS